MGSRDHSEECEKCGLYRGGMNDLKCDCDVGRTSLPKPPKRYLLFVLPFYSVGGGWEDFEGAYDSITEAKSALGVNDRYAQIVDLTKMKIVAISSWCFGVTTWEAP